MAEEKLSKMRAQVYKDPRPEEHFAPYHERVRTGDPDWVYEATRMVACTYAWTFFRLSSHHAFKVPVAGPVIIAPNHFSFMDHFFVAAGIRRRVQFMAKSQMFKGLLRHIYTHGGVFPVRRGVADEEAFVSAEAILGRGNPVVMYCEGGRSRSADLSERPKRGIGRLALQSGAIVVPTAIHGSSKVRNWKRGQFPKVHVKYGDPLRWDAVETPTRDQQQAVADTIFGEIKSLYAGLDADLAD